MLWMTDFTLVNGIRRERPHYCVRQVRVMLMLLLLWLMLALILICRIA
jgi:hypothetical protein